MSWDRYNRTIGDVCEVIAGQSPKSSFYNKIGQGLPFYQGKKEFTDAFHSKLVLYLTSPVYTEF